MPDNLRKENEMGGIDSILTHLLELAIVLDIAAGIFWCFTNRTRRTLAGKKGETVWAKK